MPVVSPDTYVYDEAGNYAWTPDRVKEAWAKATAEIKRLLPDPKYTTLVLLVGIPASGKSTWLKSNARPDHIYVDATFTEARWRAPYIEMAKEHGKAVWSVYVDSPIALCLDRNSCRPKDRQVPADTIVNMAVHLQADPPRKSEGIDVTIRVNKAASRVAAAYMAKKGALVGTDSASVYALSPESMMRLSESGKFKEAWDGHDFKRADELVRMHGGAVFHTGSDGTFDVKIPTRDGFMPIVAEEGLKAPYGTPGYHDAIGKVAAAWQAKQSGNLEK